MLNEMTLQGPFIMGKRDNSVHYSLVNWGQFIRLGMVGPCEQPNNASWQDQITDQVTAIDPPDPQYVDEKDAKRTQDAMVRYQVHDMKSANVLMHRYRDGWMISGVKRARRHFWRWL